MDIIAKALNMLRRKTLNQDIEAQIAEVDAAIAGATAGMPFDWCTITAIILDPNPDGRLTCPLKARSKGRRSIVISLLCAGRCRPPHAPPADAVQRGRHLHHNAGQPRAVVGRIQGHHDVSATGTCPAATSHSQTTQVP
jgi:hypothetical protein